MLLDKKSILQSFFKNKDSYRILIYLKDNLKKPTTRKRMKRDLGITDQIVIRATSKLLSFGFIKINLLLKGRTRYEYYLTEKGRQVIYHLTEIVKLLNSTSFSNSQILRKYNGEIYLEKPN